MAKIRADQLAGFLKKGLAPVYLVTGDEPLQQLEACDHIRAQARKEGFTERELHHTDSGFEWSSLYHSANSISLFADKKIIEIRVHNGKPEDKGSHAIVEFCENANADTLLLLVCPKLDKRSQNAKWFKAIESVGHVVTIWPISPQHLPRWLDNRLKAAGLQASQDAVGLLASKVEGNLLAAVQEIEKLKLISPENNHIDAHTMAQAVISSARYDVYGMVDKALTGHARGATTSLQGLKTEGTEPRVILWALTSEIRKLTAIKEAVANGKGFDWAAKNNGVWDSRKPIMKQALARHELPQLYDLVRKSVMADKLVKGAIKGDVWNLILDMVLDLSGTQVLTSRTQRALLG